MQVHQIMTRKVLTVGPEASLRDVATILVEHGISGIPVCDAEWRVLGVVSEGDILFKAHDPTSGRKGGQLAHLEDGTDLRAVAKSQASTAGEAMTAPAITIEPDRSVADAARLMVERGVNRLPVVTDGRLAGIVTRTDVVRAFTRSDSEIEAEVRILLLRRTPCSSAAKSSWRSTEARSAFAVGFRQGAMRAWSSGSRPGFPASSRSGRRLTWSVDDSGPEAMRAARGTQPVTLLWFVIWLIANNVGAGRVVRTTEEPAGPPQSKRIETTAGKPQPRSERPRMASGLEPATLSV